MSVRSSEHIRLTRLKNKIFFFVYLCAVVFLEPGRDKQTSSALRPAELDDKTHLKPHISAACSVAMQPRCLHLLAAPAWLLQLALALLALPRSRTTAPSVLLAGSSGPGAAGGR